MIRPEEIDGAVVEQIVQFMETGGVQPPPDWYKLLVLALKVNAPVWEVERILSAQDASMICVPKREWLKRSLTVIFAEAQVQANARRNIVRPFVLGGAAR